MPRGRANASKWTTGKVFGVGIALMFAALFIFGGPLQYMYEAYGPDWMRVAPPDVDPDAQVVDLSVRVQYKLGRDVPGAGQVLDVYDANMVPIESATSDTTTGVATFQSDYWEGETIYIQVYVAPNTAAGLTYTSDLLPYTVPDADVNGDAQLPQLELREPGSSTAAPTFTLVDNSNNAVADATSTYINSTDASLRMTVILATADTCYGLPTNVHDERTGFDYLAGGFIRVMTNWSLELTGWDYMWSESTSYYYVWNVATLENDADIPSDGAWVFTLPTASTFAHGGGVTNCTFVVDMFDAVRLNSAGNLYAAGFFDFDTTNTVTAITTCIHTV